MFKTLKFLNVDLTGYAGTLRGTPNSSSALFSIYFQIKCFSMIDISMYWCTIGGYIKKTRNKELQSGNGYGKNSSEKIAQISPNG
jgi:hypothetical protein